MYLYRTASSLFACMFVRSTLCVAVLTGGDRGFVQGSLGWLHKAEAQRPHLGAC
eukprot:COSAG01_NODE_49031_length_375_cov_3.427536_1_plen_53_part_10